MQSMVSPPAIGLAIQHLRREIGWTTYDLAELAEVTPAYISLLEGGKRYPSWVMLCRLAGLFDRAPSELLFCAEGLTTNKE